MKDASQKILAVLLGDFSRNTFFRALALSVPFAFVMTVLIGGLEGDVNVQTAFPWFNVVPGQHRWIGIVFVLITLLLTLVGYFSLLNARDDLLTPLRKKLVGIWKVRTQSWRIEQGKIAFGWVQSNCIISIESLAGKLVLRFEVRDSDVFKDQDIDITTTAFSFQGVDTKLIYFFETLLELKEPVGIPPDQVSEVKFPFLGVLRLKFESEQKVNSMSGYWYDIDNAIYNLARRMGHLQGFDDLREKVEQGAVTFGGRLEFTRLAAPEQS
jgi:hypothetical protein